MRMVQIPGKVIVVVLAAAVISGVVAVSPPCSAETEIRALLIGSKSNGPTNWITKEAFYIENILEFNGIPYDFFDIQADVLDQATLDGYAGVILEGYAMRWSATGPERALIADNMETGNITVLLGLIMGTYEEIDSVLYSAIDVHVDGLANQEANIHLLPGATCAYDYDGEDGFVVCGGYDGKHVGIAVKSFGIWSGVSETFGGDRTFGLEFALETWMQNAFGVDARVTMPVISVRLDDTETTTGERHQEVIDFIDANKHRIRAAGYLVTDWSAYQGSDSTLQSDEEIMSRWGTMSLHGKDHGTVGAEGENRDYTTQFSDMSDAVAFLQEHFTRYGPMKACPNNSWNAATLHAMANCGVPYHTASYRKSPEYRDLYTSLFDVASELERVKMSLRGEAGQLRYYALADTDETGVAKIYSVDWGPLVDGVLPPEDVLPELRQHGLDWWIPVVVGTHYWLPGDGGANNNPAGWMAVMDTLIKTADEDSYTWRRWADTYELAVNLQRFDQDLTVNEISVSGNTVIYDITTDHPVRFMTLKVDKDGYVIESVVLDGSEYVYFGDDYVHLPEMDGSALITVNLTDGQTSTAHLVHIDPAAVVEWAGYSGGRLDLDLSGEFEATARIVNSNRVFSHGRTSCFSDGREELTIDPAQTSHTAQLEFDLAIGSGRVEVQVTAWDTTAACYRAWTEIADAPGVSVNHTVGDLLPDSSYFVRVDGSPVDTCTAGGGGAIAFTFAPGCTTRLVEIVRGDLASVTGPEGSGEARRAFDYLLTPTPTPSRGPTSISYHVSAQTPVVLGIYSVTGCLVTRLVDDVQPAGFYTVRWDGTDTCGGRVGAGVYFCRLQTSRRTGTHKLIKLR
jgi:hypothetical protein